MLNPPYPPQPPNNPAINPNPIYRRLQPLTSIPPIMSKDKQIARPQSPPNRQGQAANSYQGKPSPEKPQPLNNNLNGKTKKTRPPGHANNKTQFQRQPKSYGGILQECGCVVLDGLFFWGLDLGSWEIGFVG